jgi:hypothetical protein
MLGIDDDDALQAPGGIGIGQPETRRHGSNLGPSPPGKGNRVGYTGST